MIWAKTVLVRSRLDIFVDSGQNQRLQYFRGWAEKRDRPIRSSYGGILARKVTVTVWSLSGCRC